MSTLGPWLRWNKLFPMTGQLGSTQQVSNDDRHGITVFFFCIWIISSVSLWAYLLLQIYMSLKWRGVLGIAASMPTTIKAVPPHEGNGESIV